MEHFDAFDLLFLDAVDDPIRAFNYLSNGRVTDCFDDSSGSWESRELITSLKDPVYDPCACSSESADILA